MPATVRQPDLMGWPGYGRSKFRDEDHGLTSPLWRLVRKSFATGGIHSVGRSGCLTLCDSAI